MVRSSNTSTSSRNLILYAKFPRSGTVETRLVPPFTHDEAADLYRALLHDLLHRLVSLEETNIVLSMSRPSDVEPMRGMLETWGLLDDHGQVTLTYQRGEDLGSRFDSTLNLSAETEETQTLILGSDHPTIPLTFLVEGFTALGTHDIVVGPAEDGGFYSIGAKRLYPNLFKGLPWSTDRLTDSLLSRCRGFGLSVYQLPVWYDVDRPEDVRRLLAETESSEEYSMLSLGRESIQSILNRSGFSSSAMLMGENV